MYESNTILLSTEGDFGSLRSQEIYFAFFRLPLFQNSFIDANSSIHVAKLYLLFCSLNESFPEKCDCLIHAVISSPDLGISLRKLIQLPRNSFVCCGLHDVNFFC